MQRNLATARRLAFSSHLALARDDTLPTRPPSSGTSFRQIVRGAILARRHSEAPLERVVEIRAVAEADAVGDLRDLLVRLDNEHRRHEQPALDDVRLNGHPD